MRSLILILSLISVSVVQAGVLCSQTHSATQYTSQPAVSRAWFWSMPRVSKEKLFNQIFKENKIPENLVVETPIMANRLSARSSQMVRAIIEDLNYRVGFYYESQLQVRIVRDLSGEIWGVHVSQRGGLPKPQEIAVYSVENEGGRKVPKLVFDYTDFGIL